MATTATLRLPVALKKRLTAAARRRGLTLSRYLIESAAAPSAAPCTAPSPSCPDAHTACRTMTQPQSLNCPR